MQDTASPDTKLIFSIVDLHALTALRPHGLLTQWKREMLAAILAVGIDPSRSTIFYQSTVPQHAELQWILSCTASMGYLQRMTSWKAKLAQQQPSPSTPSTSDPTPKLGLLSYPVLQAADILLHRATHVPVGEDQRQHLEFARECVANFHAAYLPTRTSPKILVPPETILSPSPRVRSLTDPSAKMSKSDRDPRSRLLLTDDRATVRKKVMGAVTDGRNEVTWEPEGRPGVANLLRLWGYFDPEGRGGEELAGELRGEGLGVLKERVAGAVSGEMEGVRERFEEIMGRGGGFLEGVAEEGRGKAWESAEGTMRVVRGVVELG